MNFQKYSEDYLLSLLLNEAPTDNNAMGQTANMQNSPNAAYEPTEQSAEMNTSMDVSMDDGGMSDDMGMGEADMGGGDPSMGGDTGMGDPSMGSEVNTKDVVKKRKIFKDYKELLEAMEDMEKVANGIMEKALSNDTKKVFTFIYHKMEENKEKVVIILTEQFFNLSYQQLLTIYMYLKMATKLYSDMLKQVNALAVDEI